MVIKRKVRGGASGMYEYGIAILNSLYTDKVTLSRDRMKWAIEPYAYLRGAFQAGLLHARALSW